MPEVIVCATCGRHYYFNSRKGHGRTRCNSCIANATGTAKRQRAFQYLGGHCVRCGYDRCQGALHFHHREHDTKTMTIATNFNRSWDVLKAELDKCDLLCANCHAEVHAAETGEARRKSHPGRPRGADEPTDTHEGARALRDERETPGEGLTCEDAA